METSENQRLLNKKCQNFAGMSFSVIKEDLNAALWIGMGQRRTNTSCFIEFVSLRTMFVPKMWEIFR